MFDFDIVLITSFRPALAESRRNLVVKGFEPSTYGDAFADVYDEWYSDVSDVTATIETLCRLGGEGPFLELGVGTGRIALELAATGAQVTGVDSSAAMLERLRAKIHERSRTTDPDSPDRGRSPLLDLIHADMTRDLPTGPYSVVFIAYNTFFSLGSLDAQQQLFAEVARRLGPQSVFVIEAAVPDVDRPAGDTVAVRSLAADRVVLSIDVHEPQSQVVEGQFVEFTESNGVRLRPWRIRYCTTGELDAMASAAGLELRDRWENMHGDPFTFDSACHVSVYSIAGS